MIKVGIIGANGYTGAELMKILARHPYANVEVLVSRAEEGKKITEIYPNLTSYKGKTFSGVDMAALKSCEVVFSCLPHAASAELCSELYSSGVKIIDLSADFRYKNLELYEATYKVTHPSPDLLKDAVYGLPEINRAKIKQSTLIGNPGCYTTSAIVPLYPIIKEGIVKNNGIIIDSKSGVSGAGKKANIEYNFNEVNESLKAYAVTTHRHTSEIEEVLSISSNKEVTVSFTPHLLPITRGILSTIYAPLAQDVSCEEIAQVYNNYYKNEQFIHVGDELPEIKWAAHNNNIFIGFRLDKKNNQLIIISVLDNLVKGAAGQAVQNFNIITNMEEGLALC